MIQIIYMGRRSISVKLRLSSPVGLATCCSALGLIEFVIRRTSSLTVPVLVKPHICPRVSLVSLSSLAPPAIPIPPTPLRLGVIILILTILVSLIEGIKRTQLFAKQSVVKLSD